MKRSTTGCGVDRDTASRQSPYLIVSVSTVIGLTPVAQGQPFGCGQWFTAPYDNMVTTIWERLVWGRSLMHRLIHYILFLMNRLIGPASFAI